ncbi:MAG: heavy metal-binding domain-containing protein [Thermoanaerobaculia bacterium]
MQHGSPASNQHDGMAGMQHGSPASNQHDGMAGMQHGGMRQGEVSPKQNGGMAGMQMGAHASTAEPAAESPRSSAEVSRLRPSETLRADEFDAPARTQRAAEEGGMKGDMQMEQSPPPEAAPNAAVYTCVMHPEVIRGIPGVCPKCGMKLVRKGAKRK